MPYEDPNKEWNEHQEEGELAAWLIKQGEELGQRVQEHLARREALERRDFEEGIDPNKFIAENARWSWTRDGLDYWICVHPLSRHFCGYVRFPRRILQELGRDGIVAYVPVHGGVTWAKASIDGTMVYGFDCNHPSDRPQLPLDDFERRLRRFKQTRREIELIGRPVRRTFKWLRANVETMAAGLQCAARYEQAYLDAGEDTRKRAAVLDHYHQYLESEGLGRFELTDNLGAMLRVVFSRL